MAEMSTKPVMFNNNVCNDTKNCVYGKTVICA